MEDTQDTTLIGATEMLDARDRVNTLHQAGEFDLAADCARVGFDAEALVPVAQNYMEYVVLSGESENQPLPLLIMTAFCMGAHVMASALHAKNSAE